MRCLRITICAAIFLPVAIMYLVARASAGDVEIEFGGLSPAAQKAITNMSMSRQEIKTQLESPMEQLNVLIEIYRCSCGQGEPTDEGCETLFNQIIGAHKGVMQTILGFLNDYKMNLRVVVEELGPQIPDFPFDDALMDNVIADAFCLDGTK